MIIDEKTVTVYIATHNRSQLLIRAIESVLSQSHPGIEIIVADDGSTDDTYEKLTPLILEGKIKYFKNDTPKGACVARNLAITEAQGEFITGMDDDDIMEPNRVEHLLKEFLSGSYSCIASSIKERTPNGDIVRRLDIGDVELSDLLHYNILGNQVLTKTEYLREIGGFDPQMPAFQDYDTWVRLVQKFGKAIKSAEPSYVWFTDHSYGRISESSERRVKAFELFYNKHKALMTKEHHDSFKILGKRLRKEKYTLTDFFTLTNSGNWKSSLSLLINTNLKPLKFVFDALRTKLHKK